MYKTGRRGFKVLRGLFPNRFEYNAYGQVYCIRTDDSCVKAFMDAHTYAKNPNFFYVKA